VKRVIAANIVGFTFVSLSLCASGCKNNDGGGGGSPGTSAQVSAPTTPTPAPPQDAMRVKSGSAPITFLVSSGGNVRIVDATSGKELLRQKVAPQTIVSIDATEGIKLGDNRALKGPLPADHQYEIWLDR
jgi:hypothetical protein